jgi:hypothetical protein
MKKIYQVTLLFLMIFMLIACEVEVLPDDQKPIDENINEDATQLFVGNLLGGYGEGWLRSAKAKFEKEFEDYSFEPNKKGVQVIIDSHRHTYKGDVLASKITGLKQEVFFTESVQYYEFVNQNRLADISDIVKEELTNYGESRSIEDKLSTQQKDFLTAKDGKYYALPFYEAYSGINYDIDLFVEKRFYFSAQNNNGNNGFIMSNDEKKSNGPDGISGTYDDGLPATYDEFLKLLDYMANKGVTPLIWTGQYQEYVNKFAAALAVDADGFDNSYMSYSFDGSLSTIVDSIDAKGVVSYKPKTNINLDNGYLTFQTSGRYYALKLIDSIVKNSKFYSNNAFNNSISHIGAQETFLYSKYFSNSPIAMLIEGSYWENEATGIFNDMMSQGLGDEASKYNRNFGFMPYPKPTSSQVGEPITLLDFNYSMAFINGNVNETKLAVAKAFLQFIHTDKLLADFTIQTNTPKPYDYSITDDQKGQLSTYGKSLIYLHENGQVLYPYHYNRVYVQDPGNLNTTQTFQGSINGTPYNLPSLALKENRDVDATNYFWSIANKYNKKWWDDSYK